MKTLLVIPSKGQSQYLPELADCIAKLTVKPAETLLYLDRPQGRERIETERFLKSRPDIKVAVNYSNPDYVGHPQMNAGEEYFLAGHVRNLAIRHAMAGTFDSVVFIDGDCMPEPDLIAGHEEMLAGSEPRISIGKRRELKWGREDQRVASDSLIKIFGKNGGKKIDTEFFFVDSGVVWTCNFGINMEAVNSLHRLNKLLYGRTEVFSSDFSGTWGGEDGFLGFECFYGGIGVYSLKDGRNGIVHKEHERPLRKYDHKTFIDFLEFRREELLSRMDAKNISHLPFIPREKIIEDYHRMAGV